MNTLPSSPAASVKSLPMPLPKSLQGLLDGLATVAPNQARAIRGLSLDSRRVGADELFLAVRGAASDGRDYIQQALQNGAAAVAHEPDESDGHADVHADVYNSAAAAAGVPSFAIHDLRQHIGAIAARFYDHPSAAMRLIGITGTNGKTTCAYLLAQALERLGTRCGLMGTLGVGWVDAGLVDAPPRTTLTTADAIDTHRALAALRANQAQAVCMEVSSHGLAQGRVNRVAFDVAVLTNFSQDHLDYHRSMARYAEAKEKLFHFEGLSGVVINADDAFGRQLLNSSAVTAAPITYGIQRGAVRPRNIQLNAPFGHGMVGSDMADNRGGITFEVAYRRQTELIRSPLIGAINVPNLLASIAALLACGYDLGQIAAVIGQCQPPPGRMVWLRQRASQPSVVVDYAHTPDALRRALVTLAELGGGELWVVFGCGGQRDADKRARMGAAAEALADHVIITDDNPRMENPRRITAQIASGMRVAPRIIHDRRRAIETAVSTAAAGDIVLLAGKGHESTQAIGGRQIALNDRDLALKALEDRA